MAAIRLVPSSGPPIPVEIDSDRVVVGREPTCDVVVADGSVSRKHAIVERRGEAFWVVDQGSANGTFLDSVRITEEDLRSGQELRFGAIAYRVEVDEEEVGATVITSAPDMPDATVMQPSLAGSAPPPRPLAPPPPAPPRPGAPAPPPPWAAPPPPPPAYPTAGAGSSAPPPPPRVGVPPPLPVGGASVPPPPPGRPGASRPPVVASPSPGGGPPAKGRSPWVYGAGGCCGCLVLIIAAFGVMCGGAFYMAAEPVKAVRAQLEDIKKGDMDAAYARMSTTYRAEHGSAEFASFVARHPALKDNKDSTFLNRSVTGSTAVLSGTLAAESGESEAVAYTLVTEGGDWKIDSLNIAGEQITSPTAQGGGGPGEAAEAPSAGGNLTLETVGVEKTPEEGGRLAVVILLRVRGFGTDDGPGGARADLALDLETRGPDGKRIEPMSRMALQTFKDVVPPGEAYLDFKVNLTLRDMPEGTYLARLTVRDQLGRDIKTQEVPLTLP